MKSGTLPWTRSCFVCGEENSCGLRLKSRIEGERIVLDYVTRPGDVGYRHIVHGGISMTLLDEVMTWAAILSTQAVCVAAEVSVRLKQPLSAETAIRVEGWVEKAGRRLVVTSGCLLDANDGRIYLEASGKYMPMPADQVHLCEKDFVWDEHSLSPADLFKTP
jgi:acyl-coenzyme A thioesterase PaaI-like protein